MLSRRLVLPQMLQKLLPSSTSTTFSWTHTALVALCSEVGEQLIPKRYTPQPRKAQAAVRRRWRLARLQGPLAVHRLQPRGACARSQPVSEPAEQHGVAWKGTARLPTLPRLHRSFPRLFKAAFVKGGRVRQKTKRRVAFASGRHWQRQHDDSTRATFARLAASPSSFQVAIPIHKQTTRAQGSGQQAQTGRMAGVPAPPTPQSSSSAGAAPMAPQARPQADHVGILAAEVYFPATYVSGWLPSGRCGLFRACAALGLCSSGPASSHAHASAGRVGSAWLRWYRVAWPPVFRPGAPPLARHSHSETPLQVRHEDLEKHDGVPSGKYTVGLGQQGLAFVGDREDSVSMALTVTKRLLERHSVSPLEVGRLEVGTETSIDSSKSIKTYLMMLFEEAGNTDLEVRAKLAGLWWRTALLVLGQGMVIEGRTELLLPWAALLASALCCHSPASHAAGISCSALPASGTTG